MAARQIFLHPEKSINEWASIGCFGTKCFRWSHQNREFTFSFAAGGRSVVTKMLVPEWVSKVLVVTDPDGLKDPLVNPMYPPKKQWRTCWERGFYLSRRVSKEIFEKFTQDNACANLLFSKECGKFYGVKNSSKCGFLYKPYGDGWRLPYFWWADEDVSQEEILSLLGEKGSHPWDHNSKVFYEEYWDLPGYYDKRYYSSRKR